jgi:raffinose/stachyose/melibiose transport system substrate-binding protein
MPHKNILRALAVAAVVALSAAACSSGGSDNKSKDANGPITLTWWHNGNNEPLLSLWKQVADDFHASHPKVSFKIQPFQNEQFTTKIPVALQGKNPPHLYQQWGGGNEASQVKSGKLMDLTSDVSGWIGQLGHAADGWKVNGKQYGVPYDQHVVGFWYRTDLFQQAGITSPPKTIDELNTDVTKLKSAGIAPIAIGSKDKWPDAFYYDYFAVRECSTKVLKAEMKAQKLNDKCWTKAGQDVKDFLATNPFQSGFLGTPAQQGAGSSAGMLANGKAAMELQGDWDLSTMTALTEDKALPSKLSWFTFPTVPGGHGDPDVVLGGGDGFSCTTKATKACADFLKYMASPPVQKKLAQAGVGLPVNPAAASALTDPTVKKVLDASRKANYIQTYFDIALPTSTGQAMDDAAANLFAGKADANAVAQAVNNAATGNR